MFSDTKNYLIIGHPKSGKTTLARNIMDNIIVSDTCIITIEALSSWQFIKPKTGNTSSEMPQHNEYSHVGDAITYFCFNHTIRRDNINNKNVKKKNYYSMSSGVDH